MRDIAITTENIKTELKGGWGVALDWKFIRRYLLR